MSENKISELLKTRLANFEEEVRGNNSSIYAIEDKIRERALDLKHDIDFTELMEWCGKLELLRERACFLDEFLHNIDFVVREPVIKRKSF